MGWDCKNDRGCGANGTDDRSSELDSTSQEEIDISCSCRNSGRTSPSEPEELETKGVLCSSPITPRYSDLSFFRAKLSVIVDNSQEKRFDSRLRKVNGRLVDLNIDEGVVDAVT